MDNFDIKEKLWGGIFGLIAILAAVAEMFLNGLSTASILGAVKDVSGTLVVVVLLIAVIRSLIPPKYKMPFEERLEAALIKWQSENSNLIVKKPNSDGNSHYGFSLKTDMTSFFKPSLDSANAGWFVRVPTINTENYNRSGIEVLFNLNRGTFFENRSDLTLEQKNEGLNRLSQYLYAYITKHFSDRVDRVSISGKENITIIVVLKNSITTDQEIDRLIELINGMYQGYLVAANIDLIK
jgi:hypothetical protein